MERPNLFFNIGDLIVVFLYGLALSYFHSFIYPLETVHLWIASGLLAFFLGSFGPEVDEILEWIIGFGLGVMIALMAPQGLHYFKTGDLEIRAILDTALHGLPFILMLLSPWIVSLPLGFLLSKIYNRNYYRHARFF